MAGVLQVILPSDFLTGTPLQASTLFLLAPEGEDGTRWLRHTQAERLSDQYGIAIVLVGCLQGCYTDMAFGYRFFQSLSNGVPAYLRRILPAVPINGGKALVAGASMGGMGAVKWALAEPERFAAAASFSGRLNNRESFLHPVEGDWLTVKRMINLWGNPDAIPGSDNDLYALLHKAAQDEKKLPGFYISAGSGDIGLASSRAFASDSRVHASWVEREGKQGWACWAHELECFLQWAAQEGGTGDVAD
jgi:S-formylglutathione hydrolase FrmB